MSNPVVPDLNEASAEALSATVDSGTGIKHQLIDADDTSSPSAFAQLINLERKFMILLAASAYGAAIWLEGGLNVGVYALTYMIGTTEYAYAGDASTAMIVSATNYLYLDSAATLKISTSGWRSGPSNLSLRDQLSRVRTPTPKRGACSLFAVSGSD